MKKQVIITLKEKEFKNMSQSLIEKKLSSVMNRILMLDVGLVMGQVEDTEIGQLLSNSLIESIEEDQNIQLPPPDSDIQ